MKKLLVQACCGPCATICKEINDCAITYFFNGDNFDSRAEYDRRRSAMMTVEVAFDFESIIESYNPRTFENCGDCIRYRLERCATFAHYGGFDCFTTSLTVSPHKSTQQVNQIGQEVSKKVGVPFVELDLKKNGGFQKSIAMSKELGLYRQNYCGCKPRS